MALKKIKHIPKLKVGTQIRAAECLDAQSTCRAGSPDKAGVFHYEARSHKRCPHVVKFSGGATSGMMLFTLLEAGLLKAERGDVVIFNNTSCEHPNTYEFAAQCKRIVEARYGIPFFWLEYQTYEDARQGEYVRLPAFKLVNTAPASKANPDGYHHKGEVFEEMLSFKGYVPNVFQRTCTQTLKLETSRSFLREWFANKPATARLGHFGKTSRINEDEQYKRHISNGGAVPQPIFAAKKAYLQQCPLARAAQSFVDFSAAVIPFTNQQLVRGVYGAKAHFGGGGIEYVSFVGIRHDEMQRVSKIQQRNAGGPAAGGHEGEHVYMPLAAMGISADDVHAFWNKQTWRLALNKADKLGNCVFCFMKGKASLLAAKAALEQEGQAGADHAVPSPASTQGTPCDLRWWADIEERYGRDLKAEAREIKSTVPNDFIGFFGASRSLSYRRLADADPSAKAGLAASASLPCDCTD